MTPEQPMSSGRIGRVRKILNAKGFDALLVTNMKNVRYLSGFTGSSGFLLVLPKRIIFATDFRYQEQAAREVRAAEIIIERGKRIILIRSLIKKLGIQKLGFEFSASYAMFDQLQSCGAVPTPLKDAVEKLRAVKDADEIAIIQRAVLRAEAAYRTVRPRIRAGVREVEIARRLDEALRKQGCRHAAFEIIVAAGPNSSMPHARPTERKIAAGDLVIVDWGGEADGYYSDMTRTVLVPGEIHPKKREIYSIVNHAREKAIKAVEIGKKTQDIDAVARTHIRNAGYGDHFGHSLGHGIGLDVHEYPYVSWTRGQRVRDGMLFTIEPGIYLPGLGGVRIEDVLLVRDGSVSILTNLGREAEGGVE